MSRAPFVVAKAESAYSRDFKVFDTTIGARFPNPQLVEQYGNHSMPETGDNVAAELNISRDACDRFAAASQAKYAAAKADGFYVRRDSACRGANRTQDASTAGGRRRASSRGIDVRNIVGTQTTVRWRGHRGQCVRHQ
ncbi:thiolase family protein [Paludibacterium denitrificans]|uniref:thiolase family protein n=1 Tax=Paludibacterium denitrificans TaxID=2675226 RepID=UPI002477EBFA|nr:hypothetical protein [Paludibacterium denitrificans]